MQNFKKRNGTVGLALLRDRLLVDQKISVAVVHLFSNFLKSFYVLIAFNQNCKNPNGTVDFDGFCKNPKSCHSVVHLCFAVLV